MLVKLVCVRVGWVALGQKHRLRWWARDANAQNTPAVVTLPVRVK